MRNLIGVFCLLTMMGCQQVSTGEPSRYKTIMIKAVGEAETLPNMATFHIDLSCMDRSVKTSKKCLVDKSNELHTELRTFGIDADDILTTSVNMDKSYAWRNNSSVFEGYRSSTTVFVTVRDIEKLDEIYTELLENRNLELSGLSYSHSAIDSLSNVAHVNALEKAGILADELLGQMPGSKKEILKIGNVEITASLPEPWEAKFEVENERRYKDDMAADRTIAISKGTVVVSATLYVEYQIK